MNYDKEFKEDAIRLSDEIGVKKAADCIVHNKTTQNCKRKSPLLQS